MWFALICMLRQSFNMCIKLGSTFQAIPSPGSSFGKGPISTFMRHLGSYQWPWDPIQIAGAFYQSTTYTMLKQMLNQIMMFMFMTLNFKLYSCRMHINGCKNYKGSACLTLHWNFHTYLAQVHVSQLSIPESVSCSLICFGASKKIMRLGNKQPKPRPLSRPKTQQWKVLPFTTGAKMLCKRSPTPRSQFTLVVNSVALESYLSPEWWMLG